MLPWVFRWLFVFFYLLVSHIYTHTPAEPLPFQSIASDCMKYQALFLHNRRNTYQDYALLLWYELQLNKTCPAAQRDQVFELTCAFCENSLPRNVKQEKFYFFPFFCDRFSKVAVHGALISFYLCRWDILASR